jgi:pimeloyl-ACP methyl ester carboxylesterase
LPLSMDTDGFNLNRSPWETMMRNVKWRVQPASPGDKPISRLLSLCALTLTLLLSSCTPAAPSPTSSEVAPEPTAKSEPTPDPAATFEETSCPFNVPEGTPVKCGFVVVPEDHSNPDGPTIRLAVVVAKDQSDEHQPDPVILLAGGPGERAVANALQFAPTLTPLHPKRDLIIFDQRGVGDSEPALECPEFVQAILDNLNEPDVNVATETMFNAFMSCRDRLVSQGINLAAYTTTQSAGDVDAIRTALGYEQINLYGGSYGSLLAQATMRDFPDDIRSVAMNSTLPLEKSVFVDATTTVANAILRLLDSCAADEACNGAYPDLQTVLFEVIDRLNAEPIPITVTNPLDGQSYDALLTGDAVRGNLGTFLYISRIIPVLPQAIFDVHNGDVDLMTQLSSTRLALLDLLSRGMMLSVMCNEDLVGRTPKDLLNITAGLPSQLVSSADPEFTIEYGMFGICENWPVPGADLSAKEPLVSDIPTLVLEGEFDPVTPPEYGQLVASYLLNGYYFEFPGVGHDVLSNDCALQIAGAFVTDPTQAPEATCISQMSGVSFDIPGEAPELVMEAFIDEERGFSGLVPAGWQELAPANLARGQTALDPTYFVLEASDTSADVLFASLIAQLGIDPAPESIVSAEVGSFSWDFYRFENPGGNMADLAIAEDGEKAYFVYLVSPPNEHDALYEQLFLRAVAAMASLESEF